MFLYLKTQTRYLITTFSSGGTKLCSFWSIYLKYRQGGKLLCKVDVSANDYQWHEKSDKAVSPTYTTA